MAAFRLCCTRKMFALGVCLMATVSSVGPTAPAPAHAEAAAVAVANGAVANAAVASTYDEAACDLSESGECAPLEVALDLEFAIDLPPPPPLDLDCKDPR